MTDKPAGPREIWAWCMYDFANSAFTTLIITVAYSLYFVQVVAGHLAPGDAEFYWTWAYAASMIVVAVLSPSLGAFADARALKRRFLIWSTLICVACTAMLASVQAGDVVKGLVLFGLANMAFDLGFVFCSAFLLEITVPSLMGRVSGYGWGLGYVGGLLSLMIAYPLVVGGFTEANLPLYRTSFVVTAVFFLVGAIPTFLYLQERATPQPVRPGEQTWRQGFQRIADTARHLRRHRDLAVYLVAYLIYTDAINTVVLLAGIFANKVLDFSPADLIIYFIVMQTTAALGAVGFGFLADRIGAKVTITITLIVWIAIAIAAALVQTKTQFYVIGLFAGAVLGANQTASRTLLGRFTPPGKQGEFFGFFSFVGKFAAVVGPLVYGAIMKLAESHRWAVVSIAIFFVAGLVFFQLVNEERGMAAASTQAG